VKYAVIGFFLALGIFVLPARTARAASVVGIVTNTLGTSVQGVRISALNSGGKTVGQGLSAVDGRYAIDKLPNGQYVFKLDPLATGVKPGEGVGYLSDKGLTIDWKVSRDGEALAEATIGNGSTSAFSGWTGAAAGALASGEVVGGTLGGLVAGGILGGGNGPSGPAASPAK
jgi:hypothetical protein